MVKYPQVFLGIMVMFAVRFKQNRRMHSVLQLIADGRYIIFRGELM